MQRNQVKQTIIRASSSSRHINYLCIYLVEGLQELSRRRLLAILVKELVEARQNLGLPNAGHLSLLFLLVPSN